MINLICCAAAAAAAVAMMNYAREIKMEKEKENETAPIEKLSSTAAAAAYLVGRPITKSAISPLLVQQIEEENMLP